MSQIPTPPREQKTPVVKNERKESEDRVIPREYRPRHKDPLPPKEEEKTPVVKKVTFEVDN